MPIFFYNLVKSFWITNLTEKDISLSDLAFTIKARTSVNLLDSKHFSFTKKQLVDSYNNGSLNKRIKQKFIVLRKFSPVTNLDQQILFKSNAVIPTRQRSIVEHTQEKFEELVSEDLLNDSGDE